MIDIHHHLLFGLDDGSPDLRTSVEMARLAVADGITHVVCTPHANSNYPYRPEENTARLEQLREELTKEKLPLTLGIGSDFHLSYDNIEAFKQDPRRFTINHKDYLLVELPDYGIPRGLGETFYEMQIAGVTPILTHPERNATLQGDQTRIENWLRGGMLVQVTADSVTGNMGRTAERLSHLLLERRWVHIIASDAHNLSTRPPRMRKAYEIIAKKYGEPLAQRLCIDNPRAVFDGETLGEQDEPQGLGSDMEQRSGLQKLMNRFGFFRD